MKIEFYGDLACPWTYLGWRRLHAALCGYPHLHADVQWSPYLLNPDLPQTGVKREDFLLKKFGSHARLKEAMAAVQHALLSDGLTVHLDRITLMPPTHLAHRLMLACATTAQRQKLLALLFTAFFVDGQNIADPDHLKAIAHHAELEPQCVNDALADHTLHTLFSQFDEKAKRLSIRAVPYMLFNDRYSIAGAQDPEAFAPLLDACMIEQQEAGNYN